MDNFLQNIGTGQRPPNDKFFDESYETCKIFVRKGITILDSEELCHKLMKEFSCSVPGCTKTFNTLLDFETHYNGSHRYICATCKKCRPSSRLLDIHIQENHDSFFKLLAERQPMYQCYVSECESKFKTPTERREHCIAAHKYPKNFRFDSASHGKGKSEPELRMEVEEGSTVPKVKKTVSRLDKNQKCKTFYTAKKKTPFDDLAASVAPKDSETSQSVTHTPVKSSLAFVPRQVTSYSKLLSKKGNSQRDVLTNECMMDLGDSLPD